VQIIDDADMTAAQPLSALFVLLAATASVSAQSYQPAPSNQLTWRGNLTGPELIVASPLVPLPKVGKGARRLVLPGPKGPVPEAAVIPFVDGGGTVTLLARWHDGWLVGTNNGEWGGALYIARPGQRIMLAQGNVIGGFTSRGYLYVLSGLRHLGLDNGELWEVDLKASRLVRRIPLPAQPNDVIVTKSEGLIIRTGRGDVALLPNGQVVPPTGG
jgi:hypothetical protein